MTWPIAAAPTRSPIMLCVLPHPSARREAWGRTGLAAALRAFAPIVDAATAQAARTVTAKLANRCMELPICAADRADAAADAAAAAAADAAAAAVAAAAAADAAAAAAAAVAAAAYYARLSSLSEGHGRRRRSCRRKAPPG